MLSTTNNRFDSGQGYSYDSSGNTTADAEGRTFVYDAENKQVEVIESSVTIGEYFYDGDGKRVKKIAGSEETISSGMSPPPANAGGTDSDAGGN